MTENSVIINKINTAYQNSSVYSFVNMLAILLNTIISNSVVNNLIFRQGFLTINYKDSFLYRITRFSTGFLIFIFRKLFSIFEKEFEQSVIVKGLKGVLLRFDLIVALSLFIILIVPDKSWYNVYGLIIVFFLFAMLIIRMSIFKEAKYSIKAMDFTYVLFFVTVLLATVTSIEFKLSSRFLMFHITCFIFVLIISSYFNKIERLNTLLQGMLMGVLAISLYGLWQGITKSVPFDPSLTDMESNQGMPGRVFSTMANPNNFAEILVMAFPFSVAMLINAKNNIIKLLNVLCIGAITGALIYTGSRSLWIAFAFSVFILLIFKKPRWIPGFLVLGLLSIPLLPDFILKRILTIGNAATDSSANYRIKIFDTVYPMLQDYWTTGVGLGTDIFMKISARYYQFTSKIPVHSHILYTQVLAEMGIMGLLTFLWTVGKTIKIGIVGSKSKSIARELAGNLSSAFAGSYISDIHIAGVASICSMLPVFFVEYIWYYPRVMIFFWIVMAIIMAANNVDKAIDHK